MFFPWNIVMASGKSQFGGYLMHIQALVQSFFSKNGQKGKNWTKIPILSKRTFLEVVMFDLTWYPKFWCFLVVFLIFCGYLTIIDTLEWYLMNFYGFQVGRCQKIPLRKRQILTIFSCSGHNISNIFRFKVGKSMISWKYSQISNHFHWYLFRMIKFERYRFFSGICPPNCHRILKCVIN